MKKIFTLVLILSPVISTARGVEIQGIRTWAAPDHTRVVFDLSAPVDYKLFQLNGPSRIVVDFNDAALSGRQNSKISPKDKFIKSVRTGMHDDSNLRVVFDLQKHSKSKTFLLEPNQKYGHRLVIDVYGKDGIRPKPVKRSSSLPKGLRDVVIAIDAGHGGEDPGAIGYRGTREKDVVLAIARKLEQMIRQERGMRPVMTRDGNYYVSLRKRTEIARKHHADFFVSIHADANNDNRIKGLSLYVLSQNGASDEAALWLAKKENASDLMGGVSLDDKDDLLASVLLDLSQSATIEASYNAGDTVLKSLRRLGNINRSRVQKAGFAVLKSPDIPSILVETAFISNAHDERKLRTAKFQKQVAGAILDGIIEYFSNNPPQGTLYAARKHVIARGDTLSELAKLYRVSVGSLREANDLKTDLLKIGQVIHIPSTTGSI